MRDIKTTLYFAWCDTKLATLWWNIRDGFLKFRVKQLIDHYGGRDFEYPYKGYRYRIKKWKE